MLGGMGGWEWGIVLVIVIIVFGVGKLPEVGGAMGKAIREFRDASAKDDDNVETETETKSESKA
ncbi:twin-arginine translocase TatA/TatE family subunit [Anaerolineales bacterium HSG24]|nr:twin-arginine translocase TatA/TatE family subunit [Anaerolineales bacterium HSG24]